MAVFVVQCIDKPDSEALRLETRPAHVAYLDTKPIEFVMAGPMMNDSGEKMIGSMFMVEAESREQVAQFQANDPYNKAGLFASVSIYRFQKRH